MSSPTAQLRALRTLVRCWKLLLRADRVFKRSSHRATRRWLQRQRLDWAEPLRADHMVRGISRAARFAPHVRCLVQALVADAMLRRAGVNPEIKIGVAAEQGGRFIAHAWVLLDGRPVLGGSARSLSRYTILTTLDR